MTPFVSIWTQPRSTTRTLLEGSTFMKYFAPLLVSFIFGFLTTICLNSIGERFPSLMHTASFSLGLSMGNYAFYFAIMSLVVLFIHMLARWLGGKGTLKATYSVAFWNQFLSVPAGIAWSWLLFSFVQPMFGSFLTLAQIIGGVIIFALSAVSFFIGLNTLSEAHGFSKRRSFCVYMLAVLIPMIPGVAIWLLVLARA